MNRPHILLVEDEANIAQALLFNLELEGYRVTHATTGAQALESFADTPCDLVILDLMLPDSHGIDICRQIRRKDTRLPILILTALGEEKHRVDGLDAGADDYLTKPFSLGEFLLRVKGMLRRSQWYRPARAGEIVTFGGNRVNLAELTAETPHGSVSLTELEGRMLAAFLAAEGRVLSRAELLEQVWGMTADTETRTLDNFVVRLRKHFEADPASPRHFRTVRGRGYRFVQEPDKEGT
ncbi:MAG: response regulator transcription factor [Desulfuromonadales bacterium]